jgi:hypothetical protein
VPHPAYLPYAADILRRQPPPRPCPIRERRANPKSSADLPQNLLVVWPDADCPALDPDDDTPLAAVAIVYGSLRHPCGPKLASLVVTSYRSDPGPEVAARYLDGRWIALDLL